MPAIFTKDSLRASVEAASGGKMTVLYDDKGYPSYMHVIPKFNLEDIDAALGNGVHPAFSVGGVEKSEIFIAAYQAIVADGRACSIPGQDPKTSVTWDQAKQYCTDKGEGWHLMTAHEWAAIALWCLKNGFQPRGNTNYGRSHELAYETATRQDGLAPGASGTARTLTGSGPASWRHDGTYQGIADLVGNVTEWNDLLKIVDGRIYVPSDNNFNLPEANWPAMDAYFDSPADGDGAGSDNLGAPFLNDAVTHFAGPAGASDNFDYNTDTWKDMSFDAGFAVPTLLKQLLIAPIDPADGESLTAATKGSVYVRNYGERMPRRGGHWSIGSGAGLGCLDLSNRRSHSVTGVGFRPAFIG